MVKATIHEPAVEVDEPRRVARDGVGEPLRLLNQPPSGLLNQPPSAGANIRHSAARQARARSFPCKLASGRCWARTSGLRLAEIEQGG